MKKIIFSIGLILCFLHVKSQSFLAWKLNDRYFSVAVGSGQTKYIGELNAENKRQTDFSHGTLAIEARLWSHISTRLSAGFYQLRGDDEKAPYGSFEKERNLSFTSNNWELNLQGIYFIRPYAGNYNQRWKFDPYLSLGFGMTTLAPFTYLQIQENGEEINAKFSLRDYQTENVAYDPFTFIIPAGVGVKMKITPFLNFNLELAYRYTFTDHLDDVSGIFPTFADDTSIQAKLSNRRREQFLENEAAWESLDAGFNRGDPNNNDQYLFFSFQIEVFLPGGKGKMFKRS
jgi:hypothetical protein|tara:strand:- start:2865 stop:3728 length:864 start_codon:yes stop_codon:yes gene_type:complete